MGVTFLKRTHPERIDADVIRGLRVDGEAPCRDGLREALAWIGDRSLPTDEAVAEAEGAITSDNHSWAMKALCLHGYGYGYCYGYGYGDGDGYGEGAAQ